MIEDNDLSILTKKEARRSWEIHDVANGMNIEAYDIQDDPESIISKCDGLFDKPKLLNIRTNRKFWHAGAGSDGEVQDHLLNINISKQIKDIEELWESRLKTL